MAHVLRHRVAEAIARHVALPCAVVKPCVAVAADASRQGQLSVRVNMLAALAAVPRAADLQDSLSAALSAESSLACTVSQTRGQIHVQMPWESYLASVPSVLEPVNLAEHSLEQWAEDHRTVLLEYSSPNIAKPFHVGHLRSTILGNALGNMLSYLGSDVLRTTYLGDWGRQFGLVAVGYQDFGSAEDLESSPLRHLFDVYTRVNQDDVIDDARPRAKKIAQQLEDHARGVERSEQLFSTWSTLRSMSLSAYDETYAQLGITFDWVDAESYYVRHAHAVLTTLMQSCPHLIKKQDNSSILAALEQFGLRDAILLKGDNTSTYLLRDIAAAAERATWVGPAATLYVAGVEQELHFRQLNFLLEALRTCGAPVRNGTCGPDRRPASGDAADPIVDAMPTFRVPASSPDPGNVRCIEHVSFGRVAGMSTRRGSVVFVDELLAEGVSRMEDSLHTQGSKVAASGHGMTARELAMSAIVVQDLKSKRSKGYTFDWDRMLRSEGDTGPFLQYTHARLASLERMAGMTSSLDPDSVTSYCRLLASDTHAVQMLFEASKLQTALVSAATSREPSQLVSQLLRIARAASSAHAHMRVQGAPPELAEARLFAFGVARACLALGLTLIGRTPLEAM